MPLKSSRFAGDVILEACLTGAVKLRKGSVGPAVSKVQKALVDLNFPLPRFGADGDFGAETVSAVMKFQASKKTLAVDGVVGSGTMQALDASFPGGEPGSGRNIPRGAHWGVDTAAPANFAVHDRSGALTTLFDLVTAELGMPEFWGRYLFGSKALGVSGLGKAEADFIRERSGGGCRILLISNIAAFRFSQGRQIGREDAQAPLNRCNALAVTPGAFVYADIEPQFQCSAGWFQGWWETMQQAGRGRGGLYAEPGQLTFNRPHRAALKETRDLFEKARDPEPVSFPPDPPNIARLLWSQRPLRFFKTNIDSTNFIPSEFAPNQPTYQPGMTAIWQYAGNCAVIANKRATIIDMNLSNDQGLASMWKQ